MELATIGIIVIAVIATILFLLVLAAVAITFYNYVILGIRIRPESEDPSRLEGFTVGPDYFCMTRSCEVVVNYHIYNGSDDEDPAAELILLHPDGTQELISEALTFGTTFAGDDPIWTEGPGAYTFLLKLTGVSSVTGEAEIERTVVALADGDMIRNYAAVTSTEKPWTEATRVFEVTNSLDEPPRDRRVVTMCTRGMQLSSVTYASGLSVEGAAGTWDPTLEVKGFRPDGTPLFHFESMTPGDTEDLPLIELTGNIRLSSTVRTTEDNRYPDSGTLRWRLDLKVHCPPRIPAVGEIG